MTKQVDKSAEPLSRAERKAELLAQMEQQRIDILVCSEFLQRSTSPLDQSWRSIKLPLYAASGVLAYRLVRRPGGIVRAARKGLAGYMLFRKLKLLTKIAT
ncbi:YqjK-like family protein [Halomonas aquamarina]|uniref:YqjK-like family protein n=1 Tax=Vreelandella aquamarina TaxID=77097 RepID=A0ACC5VXY2_9GAMM|nr:YqjK family protein [Halomonas aquamarina]MBZ5489101.1 YqjK-like family protein [Halomonas aquamarina]